MTWVLVRLQHLHFFSQTLPVCKNFQSVNSDLAEAMEFVDIVLNEMNNIRTTKNYNQKYDIDSNDFQMYSEFLDLEALSTEI